MADHRITDFVDQAAIDRLKELKDEMIGVKDAYIDVARELLKGLSVKVNNLDELNKLIESFNKANEQASQSTARLNNNINEQRAIIGRTTAAIAEQLQEQNKLDREVRQSAVDHDKIRSVLEKVYGTYDSNLKRLIDTENAMKRNSRALKDLEEKFKLGGISVAEYETRVFNITKSQRELAAEKHKLSTLLKNEEREMASVEGSYNHLSQQLELLKKAYKDLTEEEKAEPFGRDMLEAINQLDTELKYQAENMGEHQRNVGDYAIAIRDGVASIKDLNEVLAMESSTVAGCIEQNKQLEKAKKNLKTTDADYARNLERINQKIAENTAFIRENGGQEDTTKKQLKDLVLEIANLTIEYRKLTEEEKASAEGKEMAQKIKDLTEKAGVLKDAIIDTNRAINNASSDTRAFDQISGGIKLLIDGFGLAKGAASMLGLEEDDLVEVQTKLQAAIVASNAVTSIQKTLQKESAVMQGVYAIQTKAAAIAENIKTAATGKGIIATKAASVAQALFNKIAMANPYVILAMAILSVVGALIAFTGQSKKSREEEKARQRAAEESKKAEEERQRKVNEHIAQEKKYRDIVVNSAGEQISAFLRLRAEWRRLGNDFRLRQKFITDTRDRWHALGLSINSVNEMEDIFNNKTEKIVESMIKRAQIKSYEKRIQDLVDKYIDLQEQHEVTINKVPTAGSNARDITFDNAEEERRFWDEWAEDGMNRKYWTYATNRTRDERGYEHIETDYNHSIITPEGEEFLRNSRRQSASEELHRQRQQAEQEMKDGVEHFSEEIENLTNELKTVFNFSGGSSIGKQASKSAEEIAEVVLQAKQKSINDQLAVEKEGEAKWYDLKLQSIKAKEDADILSLNKTVKKNKDELKKSHDDGKISDEEYRKALEDIENASAQQIVAIHAKARSEEDDAFQKVVNHDIELRQEQAATEQAIADASYQDKMANLKSEYAEKLKLAKTDEERAKLESKYEADVAALTEQYAVETAQRQVDLLTQLLDCEFLTNEQREELARQLAEAKIELADATADAEVAAAQRTADAEKATAEAYKTRMEKAQMWLQQLAQGLNAVNDLASQIYDGKIQKIEEEQEAESDAADAEKERISQLVEHKVISEEEGEARKRAAEEKTARKNEEFEKKKQQLKYKQALWDKANGISQAGISTALAILNALQTKPFPVGLALASIAGAMGALQIATILATPIPKYAKGTSNHAGGLAIVGDGGKSEVINVGSELYLTPDKPTLVDLPKGAEVYPSADEFINQSDISQLMADTSAKETIVKIDTSRLERKFDETKSTINDLIEQNKKQTKAIQDAAAESELDRLKREKGL